MTTEIDLQPPRVPVTLTVVVCLSAAQQRSDDFFPAKPG